MHSDMVGLVALDQILRLLLRGANGVGFKLHGGSDLLLNCSADAPRFRVPTYMISNFEFGFHRYDLL